MQMQSHSQARLSLHRAPPQIAVTYLLALFVVCRAVSAEEPLLKLHSAFQWNHRVITDVAFSPDSQTLAVAGGDHSWHVRRGGHGAITIWDVATGEEQAVLSPPSYVMCLAFFRDGKTLVFACEDKSFRFHNIARSSTRVLPSVHAPSIQLDIWFALSSDEKAIVANPGKGLMFVLDVATGKKRVTKEPIDPRPEVSRIAMAPDGQTVANAQRGESSIVELVNPQTLVTHTTLRSTTLRATTRQHYSVTFSPNSQRLLTGGGDGIVRIWDVDMPRELESFVAFRDSQIFSLAFSPNGELLATGGHNEAKVWLVRGWKEAATVKGNGIFDVTFSPDGRLVATTTTSPSHRSEIKLWSVRQGSGR